MLRCGVEQPQHRREGDGLTSQGYASATQLLVDIDKPDLDHLGPWTHH